MGRVVMGNFSRTPLDVLQANLAKGYVGLHIEQGVPILDRDLNLLNDVISATVRAIVSRYIGDGFSVGREGFAIEEIPAANDFVIQAGISGPGTCLVGGIEVTIESNVNYGDQDEVAALTTPDATQPDPRVDNVFLDVWLHEVESDEDVDLRNDTDVGLQTSVRQMPVWRVRVAEGVPVPSPAPGHVHYSLARLTRPRNVAEIRTDMLTDLRESMSPMTTVERRLAILERVALLPSFAPSPNQFSPKVGAAGQNVTLFGNNFNIGTPTVLFDTVGATLVGTPTDTEISVTVPPGVSAGSVKITVDTDGGTAVSDDDFTVLPGNGGGDPPQFDPSPNQFSPKVGPANQIVTLSGSNFDGPNLSVEFGAASATVDSATATQIVARVPSGLSGPVTITVTTDDGTATSDDTFTVL